MDTLYKLFVGAPGARKRSARLYQNDGVGEENDKFQTLMMELYGETSKKMPYRFKIDRKETDCYDRAMEAGLNNFVLKGLVTPEILRFIDRPNTIVVRFDHCFRLSECQCRICRRALPKSIGDASGSPKNMHHPR